MAKTEIHNAIVTRNIESDPDSTALLRGAVYFEAPTLFDGEFPIPAQPCFPFASSPNGAGFFFVPKVGDEIEVMIQSDDPNNPHDSSDVENPEPRWRCMVYSDAADIAEEFKINYPFRMGWKSNSGSYFLFDDTEGSELVKLFHKVGTMLELNAQGDWLEKIVQDKLQDITRDLIAMIGRNRETTIQGDDTETISGAKTINVTGNVTIITDGNVDVQAGGTVNVQATGDVDVNSDGKVTITGAAKVALDGGTGATGKLLVFPKALSDFTGSPIQPASDTLEGSL